MKIRVLATLGAVALSGALLVACGDDEEGSSSGGVAIEGAWARTSPMAVDVGAAYMVITSEADDTLVSASVDASVAGEAQIHETVMAEGGMTDTTMAGGMTETTMAGSSGEMMMREIDELDLPAGEAVELKPGGYHIMMLGLVEPLEVGDEIEVTLSFENAGEQTVTVPVRDSAP
jgi:copper(I)-binding protein